MRAFVHLHGYGDKEVELTDEHASFSNERPVVLLNGQPYGWAELEAGYPGYVLTMGWQRAGGGEELHRMGVAYEMLRRAKAAGYRVG